MGNRRDLTIQLAVIGLLGLILAACSTPSAAPAPTATPAPQSASALPSVPREPIPPKASAPRGPVTTETYLAVMERGQDSPAGDPLATQFEQQLDILADKCLEDRDQLAVYLVGIHDLMARRGVKESRLSILTHVTTHVPDETAKVHCDSYFVDHYNGRMKSVGLGGGPRASR